MALGLFAVACVTVSADAADTPNGVIALKAARMFDGKSKTLVTNGVVIVENGKIRDVGSNLSIPADAQVIDLGDATLSPGFMDAHTHLTLDYSGDYNVRAYTSWISTFQSKRSERQPSRALQLKPASLPSVTWAAASSAAGNLSMWRCAIRLTKG